jgi:hypothetical protein
VVALEQTLQSTAPKRRSEIGWISSGILALFLSLIGFGIGAKIYFNGNEEWLRSAVFGAFMLVNSLRILAYVPQMLAAAKDTNGASGVSYATWSLFLVSHLTTIVYAIVYVGDSVMALIFFGNASACLVVLTITFIKRRQYAIDLMQRI